MIDRPRLLFYGASEEARPGGASGQTVPPQCGTIRRPEWRWEIALV